MFRLLYLGKGWADCVEIRHAHGDPIVTAYAIVTGGVESMEWTGSIRWIHNPVQSRRIWIGLDQKFTNLADSGLD